MWGAKQMYYNMRIKMCSRTATNLIRLANEKYVAASEYHFD
jgi:hypothetical protein